MDILDEIQSSKSEDTLVVWKAVANQSRLAMPKVELTPEINQKFEKWLKENRNSLAKFQHLNLANKGLSTLPPELRELGGLRHLDLSNNHLTELPDKLYTFQYLTILILSNNQFKKIPQNIANLINLRTLWINENLLCDISPEIGKLKELHNLYIFKNELKCLPFELGNLTKLEKIELHKNKFTQDFEGIIDKHKGSKGFNLKDFLRELKSKEQKSTERLDEGWKLL